MSARARAGVYGVGMVTSVGTGARQTATSVQAGIARLTESEYVDRRFHGIVLGSVDEDGLPSLSPKLEGRPGLAPRASRMLRLAAAALDEAAADLASPGGVPVFLALPESADAAGAGAEFLAMLALQSGTGFAPGTSRTFELGRAAGLAALEAALEAIAGGAARQVLVGGVDTYRDAALLERLDGEGRVLAEGVMDGFVPGEGAAFLLVGPADGRGAGGPSIARLDAVGRADEPGHRYSDAPFHGEGLAAAFRATWAQVPDGYPAVRSVYAGFNGESLFAKEWGTAFIRNRGRFAEGHRMEHPADCFGDAGAAHAVELLVVASLGLAEGQVEGPCLVWCSSDRATRGAALLSAAGS